MPLDSAQRTTTNSVRPNRFQFLGPLNRLSTRGQIGAIAASWIIYVALFPLAVSAIGPPTAILSTGPIVIMAWMSGFRAGLLGAGIYFGVNIVLASIFINDRTVFHWMTHGGLLGFIAFIIMGGMIGKMRDLSIRNRAEIQIRRQLEQDLHDANDELELHVEERTQQLSQAIDSLRDEIKERVQTERALMASQQQLRALAARMESVREDERAKIAHDIHDEFGQTITALKFEVAWLQRRLDRIADPVLRESFTDRIELIQSSLTVAIDTVRDISSRLRPAVLDNFGLKAAIEWHATEFQARTDVECHVNLPDQDLDIDRKLEITLFRILQEALNNVARHANASHVSISIAKIGKCIELEISDDGVGMNVNDGSERLSLGVLGMQERALAVDGVIEMISEPGHGTTVKVRVPNTALAISLDA